MTVTLDLAHASSDTHTHKALKEVSASVMKSKKIVVVTGAGISCSCGIPDFRSSDGLYALVKQQYPDVVMKGRDLFDASLFRDATSTAVFYTFISELKRSIDTAAPAPTHHFIKTLDSKKKLLRSYTQNIDGLEARVGLLGTSCQEAKSNGKGKHKIRTKDVRNVQLHGDIHRVRCISCAAEYRCTEDHLSLFNQGTPPDCPECLSRSEARLARSARPIRVGSLRPAIVLYDEPHPLGDDIGAIQSVDVGRKPDLMIIMGTSLKVHGLKKLVKEFARVIHSSSSSSSQASGSKKPYKVIFVNKTAPSSEWDDIIDCHVAGETDEWVTDVIAEWKTKQPDDWKVQQTLVAGEGDTSMSGGFKVTKNAAVLGKPSKKAVGKKKADAAQENIAPSGYETDIQTKKAPSSPSKRRQSTSHYDNLEASPSKKRPIARPKHLMPAGERKTLFTESTNNQGNVPVDDIDALGSMDCSIRDLSMQDIQDIEPIKPRRNTKRVVKEVKARATLAVKSRQTRDRRAI
ncbi:DHS-like NAD/FAD-binding domain-containing protein [Crucibulum laeve]|uniref:DHS-like NAD/FAD-binding domain-containing protein n=1 Tax=Crucibulum laeve TaxID=68775 RepID=A0A5C3LVC2_9AGAR|nr:DHS-like NAD/FAD-binding domain-containing protein [Crucibulum laeve]